MFILLLHLDYLLSILPCPLFPVPRASYFRTARYGKQRVGASRSAGSKGLYSDALQPVLWLALVMRSFLVGLRISPHLLFFCVHNLPLLSKWIILSIKRTQNTLYLMGYVSLNAYHFDYKF